MIIDFGFFALVVFAVGFGIGLVTGRSRGYLAGHKEGVKEGHALGYDEAWRKYGEPLLRGSED